MANAKKCTEGVGYSAALFQRFSYLYVVSMCCQLCSHFCSYRRARRKPSSVPAGIHMDIPNCVPIVYIPVLSLSWMEGAPVFPCIPVGFQPVGPIHTRFLYHCSYICTQWYVQLRSIDVPTLVQACAHRCFSTVFLPVFHLVHMVAFPNDCPAESPINVLILPPARVSNAFSTAFQAM